MTSEEIQNELRRLGQKIGAKYQQYPSVCQLKGEQTNIAILDDGTFAYEAYERGVQLFCYTFSNLDDLMYHTFKNIVPRMASDYATEMEAAGENFQKHFFNKTIELMGQMKPEWGKRMEDNQNRKPY